MKVAVNLISGALGSGKTTLVRQLVNQKPENEIWALLVNEFGAIGIDGAILASTTSNTISTHEIPGGCICCTAKGELQQSLLDIANTVKPDRLIIEPTGLGEPDVLVDLLTSPVIADKFDLQTLFSVFDASHISPEDLKEKAIFQSLVNMADIILLNKTDLATPSQIETLENYCRHQIFPVKHSVQLTQNAQVDINDIYIPHFKTETIKFSLEKPSEQPTTLLTNTNHLSGSHTLPYQPTELTGVLQRAYQKSLNTQSIGWVFDSTLVFDWKYLFQGFEKFAQQPHMLRAKGIFRVGKPRMLFQYVNGQATREIIAYRKDSRIELLLNENAKFDFPGFEHFLQNCIKP